MCFLLRKYFNYGLTLVILSHCSLISSLEVNPHKNSLVEVRAVFINCESDTSQDNSDNEISRFQRQELFKHNALRECNKKLALTVKIATEPGWMKTEEAKSTSSGDEYIPIDHVFEGSDRKRVRLLNPYILRLRRESPRQAYKLRRIDTVSGVLTNIDSRILNGNGKIKKQVRTRRDAGDPESDELSLKLGSAAASDFTLEHDNPARHSYSLRISRLHDLIKPAGSIGGVTGQLSKDCEQRYACTQFDNASLVRIKRHIENPDDIKLAIPSNYIRNPMPKKRNYPRTKDRKNSEYEINRFEKPIHINNEVRPTESIPERQDKSSHLKHNPQGNEIKLGKDNEKEKRFSKPDILELSQYDENNYEEKVNGKSNNSPDKDFALYEIGDPDLWFTVKVQLFEKLSTPDGKTIWNDLNQGKLASVSSSCPEWKGQDLNVRYRPTDWVPRDDFSLPMSSLCLLEPLRDTNYTSFEDESVPKDVNQDYIVVPIEDVIGLKDSINVIKRDDNVTEIDENEAINEERPRHRVEVRVSRAIFGSSRDSFTVASLGEDRFLTLPHRRTHHAQIDLEVRADDNQLVRVGSSGRISTVVADNSRKTRTILYLQVTNTGLASARFKAVARECGPELTSLMSDKGSEEVTAGPVLLPPQHTKRLHLEIPVESPIDITRCNVALVNDKDESVAVREVAIKKGDRCFCVWHCDCVCLSEDPKLVCREMSQPQQAAAGLSAAQRARRARSVCYPDDVVIDVTSVVVGVITVLLQIGLKCRRIGRWGLDKVLQMPRRLESYYERSLRCRDVVCDDAGWPVHPDTHERTVRLISWPMEFLLNSILFVVLPCLAMCEILKKIHATCQICTRKATDRFCKDSKHVYNTQDLQMQPLLQEMSMASKSDVLSAVDSEQDDTDYVLMQMQKSRESLVRSKKKVNDSAVSSARRATNVAHGGDDKDKGAFTSKH